jgi:hypothetical protein
MSRKKKSPIYKNKKILLAIFLCAFFISTVVLLIYSTYYQNKNFRLFVQASSGDVEEYSAQTARTKIYLRIQPVKDNSSSINTNKNGSDTNNFFIELVKRLLQLY